MQGEPAGPFLKAIRIQLPRGTNSHPGSHVSKERITGCSGVAYDAAQSYRHRGVHTYTLFKDFREVGTYTSTRFWDFLSYKSSIPSTRSTQICTCVRRVLAQDAQKTGPW